MAVIDSSKKISSTMRERYGFMPEQKQKVSQAPSAAGAPAQSYYTAGVEDAKAAQGQFAADPGMINQMRDMADTAYQDIRGAMTSLVKLTEGDQVDVGALTGMLKSTFDQTKDMLLSSATASARKAAFEMDAYLGSSSADSRSVVRRNIAAGVTSNILSTTQQAIAQLYSGHIDKVVDTTLKGGAINADVKTRAAAAIGQLAGDAGNLILGTNNAIAGLYSQQMNYAIELMDAHTRRKSVDQSLTIARMENESRMKLAKMSDTLARDTANLGTQQQAMADWKQLYGGIESQKAFVKAEAPTQPLVGRI